MSNAGEMGTNLIVVVNDNEMSIAENHGGLYQNLKALRDSDGKAECNFFLGIGDWTISMFGTVTMSRR